MKKDIDDVLQEMLTEYPKDVQNAMMAVGMLNTYLQNSLADKKAVEKELRSELKKVIDKLPIDKLLSLYPTIKTAEHLTEYERMLGR